MANSFRPSGQVSPTMFSRTLERVFEDAQHTGEINLSGRNLKEYSKIAEKFDLVDTTTVGEFLCNHPDVQFRLSSLQWVSLISKSPRIATNCRESPRIAANHHESPRIAANRHESPRIATNRRESQSAQQRCE